MTVDILFPYYGDVAMMKQAVLSVVGQTNPDWSRLRRSTAPRVRLFCRVRSWLPPCCAARGSTSRPWAGVRTLLWAPASVRA